VSLHRWSAAAQVCGGAQTPFVHSSVAVQQVTPAEQLWLVLAQAAAPWQVPLVAPAGMSQERPAQQSPLKVQPAPDAEQVDVGVGVLVASPHLSFTQLPLQQSVAAVALVQLPPVSLQVEDEVGSRQAKKPPISPYGLQARPEQQLVSVVPLQEAPNGEHVEVPPPPGPPPHRSTPTASGMHGWKLQHWSRNWQIWPGSMQHRGFVPSQPVGQVVEPPPKQRMMLFESGLHTAFLPSQQSCEALTVPLPPQMLPGGLHAPPLSQVWLEHWTLCETGTSSLTLQQELVESQ
jgi:hypothetical protein